MLLKTCFSLFVACVLMLSTHCAAVPAASSEGAARPLFRYAQDPAQATVFGLVLMTPTERSVSMDMLKLLENSEPTGGVALDPQGKTLFTANYQGIATAIAVESEKILWRHVHNEPLSMPPCYIATQQLLTPTRPLLILGSQNGQILGMDATQGQVLWRVKLDGEVRRAPLVADGRLFINTSRNQLSALDPATGKILWQYKRDFTDAMTMLGHAGVSYFNGKVFTGFSDGFVVALDAQEGSVKWSRPLALKESRLIDADATPQVLEGRLYVASYTEGLYALDAESGDVIWQMPEVNNITHVHAEPGLLLTVSALGVVKAMDPQSTQLLWRFNFPAAWVSQPLVYRGYVLFGAEPGGLFVLDLDSGRLMQRLNVGGVHNALAMSANGDLGFLSSASFAYVLSYGAKQSLTVRIKPRFEGL